MAASQSGLMFTDSILFNKEIIGLLTKYDIPGSAIAIIHKDQIWIDTYGMADKNEKIEVSPNTVFRLGSISKTYLAIAIMQLVEKGEIKLTDPIKTIIPEADLNNSWGEEHPVRIIHLLEHTSSIDDVHFNEGYNTTGIQDMELVDVFKVNPKSRTVRWRPGEMASYSNDAFSLLALIIEKVTGEKFEDYIQQNILDRIGTVSTSYVRDNSNESEFAKGYTNVGQPLAYVPVLMRPSGGMNSNIEDLAKFVQLLLNDGVYNNDTILDPENLNRMLFPSSSIPAQEGFKMGYGSGFSSFFVNGNKYYGHGGGLPDFKSIFLFNPELKVGIVILINKNSDYFLKLVNTVVSTLELENGDHHEKFQYSTNRFMDDEIVGYYTQANYGISLDRFPNYFLSGQKIFIEDDTLFSREFQSEKKALYHFEGNAYKRINENYESAYFFKNNDGEIMLTLFGKNFYRKDLAWKPVFDRLFLLFSIIIIVSFLLYTIIWNIRILISKLMKRKPPKTSILPRLIPLFAVISLLICLLSLSIWYRDYNNAGSMTMSSVSVFVFSLLFPIISIFSFWVCCFRKDTKIRKKLEKVYLIFVSSTLICLSIFLSQYEIIGVMLWAY